MPDFRQRLEDAIRKTGLTKYAIEKAAGLDRGHLSTILRRGSMGKASAARLAPVLGVAEGWLLADDTQREPDPPASDRTAREPPASTEPWRGPLTQRDTSSATPSPSRSCSAPGSP